jgi:predicted PurR-regulated permease PerM
MWGIPGAILAVPLLAIIKILCDRVEALKPVGHIIGS